MKMLEAAGGRKPFVAGKPSNTLFNTVVTDHGLKDAPLEEFLMIGDKIDTDIQFGKNSGIDQMLLFTGVTNKEKYLETKDNPDSIVPTYESDRLPVVELE